jgi:hypothetical protein
VIVVHGHTYTRVQAVARLRAISAETAMYGASDGRITERNALRLALGSTDTRAIHYNQFTERQPITLLGDAHSPLMPERTHTATADPSGVNCQTCRSMWSL